MTCIPLDPVESALLQLSFFHKPECSVNRPSARCDCGLHQISSTLRQAITDLKKAADKSAETNYKLPESLRDPIRVMERGRGLLARQEAETRAAMYEFLGWLSADIPELHGVEVPRLADSWERYRAKIDECPSEKSEPLCPHGMVLADNVCGPCSEGRPNRRSEKTSETLDEPKRGYDPDTGVGAPYES